MGEVATVIGGGTPKSDQPEYFGGEIPWITPADLSKYTKKLIHRGARNITKHGLDSSGARMMPAGAVLFSSRAPIGYVVIAANPVSTNQGFKSFVLHEGLTPDFVYYYLQHAKKLVVELASGTTFLEISGKRAAQIPVAVPPLPVQHRIVAELEKQFTRLEAGVAALRRVQANLKRYRAAVLKAACEGRLSPADADWVETPLRDLIGKISQGWSPKCDTTRDALSNEWAIVTTTAIQSMRYVDNQGKRLPGRFEPRPQIEIKVGDFLMTRKGPRKRAGVACLVRTTRPRLMVCDTVYRFRCHESCILPRYLEIALNSPGVLQAIDKHKAGINDSGVSLTHSKLGSVLVPHPPLDVQASVVSEVERRLSVVDELEVVVTANFQRAARLRESILHKAFLGALVSEAPGTQPVNLAQARKVVGGNRPNSHFARALLSAEIVHCLHGEPTFGRVKHQKVFHLCEHIAQIAEIKGQYHREAAGPLDNKLIYANEAELERQKWFRAVPRASVGHAYEPMARAGYHRKYLESYWPEKLSVVERLVTLLRRASSEQCEIVSTTYAAWNDLILWKREAAEAAILREILERWHDSKKRIATDRWRTAITWIREKELVPTGFGRPTRAL